VETVRSAIAFALAAIAFCMSATFLVRLSIEVLRSSPMVPAQDATDEEGEGGVSAAAGGGRSEAEEVAAGEDRCDRDTRLSRTL
jgi:hypothetical protein